MLKHLRLRSYERLLKVAQPWARRRRMRHMALLDLRGGERVIDLGGTTEIWDFLETPLDITIVNLPGVDIRADSGSRHKFHFVTGDATKLEYPDNHFDLVFSNSVIEHVGGEAKERDFAREVRRLAPSYYVQTPSIWFPLEPHTGIPFWWAIPRAIRSRMIARWKRELPAWTAMIEGTTVITRKKLRSYFPDGTLITERLAGIPKSYTVYRSGPNRARA
jgi:Methyltransferase domain